MTPKVRAEIRQLLQRLAGGDRSAIAPTFEALWPILLSFSARALGHGADAEDAAQLALMKLFAQVSDLDASRDGVAWVLTIASFECRTIRRRRQRTKEVTDDEFATVAATSASPEEAIIERDLEAAARACLAELPDLDARTILTALADQRPESHPTFRKRLQRALDRLRHAWRAKHEIE